MYVSEQTLDRIPNNTFNMKRVKFELLTGLWHQITATVRASLSGPKTRQKDTTGSMIDARDDERKDWRLPRHEVERRLADWDAQIKRND